MKIERGNERSVFNPLSKNNTYEIQRKGELSFEQELIQRQNQVEQFKLRELLQEIDKINSRLQKQLTLKDLMMYKRIVGDFLKQASLSAYRVQKDRARQRRGRSILISIQTIDNEIEIMVNEFLEKKTSAVIILETMDKIRGMLVDLMI